MPTIAGQEGLLLIRAPQAYANLYRSGLSALEASRPGNGVTIGFIDDGLILGKDEDLGEDSVPLTPLFYDYCCNEKFNAPDEQGLPVDFLFATPDRVPVPAKPVSKLKPGSVRYFHGGKSWRERDRQRETDIEKYVHGTEVVSVAAGSQFTFKKEGQDDLAFQGVAPGANIKMFAVETKIIRSPQPSNQQLRDNPGLFDFYPDAFAAALAPASGVDFLNISLSIPYTNVEGKLVLSDPEDPNSLGVIEPYTEDAIRVAAGNFIRIAAQRDRCDRCDKTVLVWAAANVRDDIPDVPGALAGSDNASSPNAPGGLMAHIPELRDHSVVVVSVDRSGAIAGYSKACGIAARWCLAAPGNLLTAWMLFDEAGKGDARWRAGIWDNQGTSFAAPMVSGGLALMKQIFRGQMSNTQLLARLLQTANKDGRYAHAGENEDGKLYGQGLMDLGAATQPSGTTSIASGSSVDGAGIALSDTALSLGSAFGDGLARSLGGQEVVAFDSLGAPFWHRLGGLTNLATFAPLGAQLRGFMGQGADFSGGTGWPASRRQSAGAGAEAGERDEIGAGAFSGGGHLSLAADPSAARLGFASASAGLGDFAVTAFAPLDHGADGSRPAPVYAATLSRRLSDTQADFGFGWIVEPKSMLGSSADGAFGELSANTAFAGLGWRGEVGAWRLNFNSEVGIAVPDQTAAPGLLNRISSLTTSAFDFGATRTFSEGSRLRLSLSQPLRVERGQADLSVPVSRTPDGLVQRDRLTADLAPSGRQLDIGVRVALPVRFGEILLGAVGSHHPNHNRDAPMQMSYLAGWRWEF